MGREAIVMKEDRSMAPAAIDSCAKLLALEIFDQAKPPASPEGPSNSTQQIAAGL
jgi:hypothetical protein